MGTSSLLTEVSLWDLKNRCGGRFNLSDRDNNWYLSEVRKNYNHQTGPVTVINFDYLENN